MFVLSLKVKEFSEIFRHLNNICFFSFINYKENAKKFLREFLRDRFESFLNIFFDKLIRRFLFKYRIRSNLKFVFRDFEILLKIVI